MGRRRLPGRRAGLIPGLGPTLVEACGVRYGRRGLDVGAGAGNGAIAAAAAGATVVASDLTPELFRAGRAAATARGVELEWAEEADAVALPFVYSAGYLPVTARAGAEDRRPHAGPAAAGPADHPVPTRTNGTLGQ